MSAHEDHPDTVEAEHHRERSGYEHAATQSDEGAADDERAEEDDAEHGAHECRVGRTEAGADDTRVRARIEREEGERAEQERERDHRRELPGEIRSPRAPRRRERRAHDERGAGGEDEVARAEERVGAELDAEDRMPEHVEDAARAEDEDARDRVLVTRWDRGAPRRGARSLEHDRAEDDRGARAETRVERCVPDRPERVRQPVAVRPAIPVQTGTKPRRGRDDEPVQTDASGERGRDALEGCRCGGRRFAGRHSVYIRALAARRSVSIQARASAGVRKRSVRAWATSGEANRRA